MCVRCCVCRLLLPLAGVWAVVAAAALLSLGCPVRGDKGPVMGIPITDGTAAESPPELIPPPHGEMDDEPPDTLAEEDRVCLVGDAALGAIRACDEQLRLTRGEEVMYGGWRAAHPAYWHELEARRDELAWRRNVFRTMWVARAHIGPTRVEALKRLRLLVGPDAYRAGVGAMPKPPEHVDGLPPDDD